MRDTTRIPAIPAMARIQHIRKSGSCMVMHHSLLLEMVCGPEYGTVAGYQWRLFARTTQTLELAMHDCVLPVCGPSCPPSAPLRESFATYAALTPIPGTHASSTDSSRGDWNPTSWDLGNRTREPRRWIGPVENSHDPSLTQKGVGFTEKSFASSRWHEIFS